MYGVQLEGEKQNDNYWVLFDPPSIQFCWGSNGKARQTCPPAAEVSDCVCVSSSCGSHLITSHAQTISPLHVCNMSPCLLEEVPLIFFPTRAHCELNELTRVQLWAGLAEVFWNGAGKCGALLPCLPAKSGGQQLLC